MQAEFVTRLTALPNHARDVHEWEGGRCDFHPLRVCTCKTCEDKWDIKCEGEPYKTTRSKLDCEFHSLAYEIECRERASQVEKLVHPVLKRGHSNACEASHNVLIRFRSKDVALERLHYHVSTNLGLLQANLTYMHAKFGSTYHWIPELYRRMQLPVFDGVVEALQKHNVRRKQDLALAKTTPHKKRRIALKKNRVLEGVKRKEWSRKHGHDTYGDDDAHDDSDHEPEEKKGKGKGKTRAKREVQGGQVCSACGSSTHKRSSHRDCPFNKKRGTCTMRPKNANPALREGLEADVGSTLSEDASSVVRCSDDAMTGVDTDDDVCQCTCGAQGRAHKRNCPMSSRGRYPGRALFPPPSNSEVDAISSDSSDGLGPDGIGPPSHKKSKLEMKVGDYVSIHGRNLGKHHLPCRIVGHFKGRYKLYCAKGVLNTSYASTDLIPLSSCNCIPLNQWRQAPRVSLRTVVSNEAVLEDCNCDVSFCPERILLSSDDEDAGQQMWVNNNLYSLSPSDRELIASPAGWLNDSIISAAQKVLLQDFPQMKGLEPPVLQEVLSFQVHTGEFVQIINVRDNHWCVVSTVGCDRDSGVVNVYDSLYSSVPSDTIYLIASMILSSASRLEVRMMSVDKQSNCSDCGVLAIAFAFDLCNGSDPCKAKFDHKNIRKHLLMCLESCKFSRFPVLHDSYKCATAKSHETQVEDLHCTCRMPEKSGDDMALCESCDIWYHKHCMDIPDEVFDESEVYWKCRSCCTSAK